MIKKYDAAVLELANSDMPVNVANIPFPEEMREILAESIANANTLMDEHPECEYWEIAFVSRIGMKQYNIQCDAAGARLDKPVEMPDEDFLQAMVSFAANEIAKNNTFDDGDSLINILTMPHSALADVTPEELHQYYVTGVLYAQQQLMQVDTTPIEMEQELVKNPTDDFIVKLQ